MGLIIGLIRLNIVPLIGMCIYGLMVIGLTILGGKLLQGAGLIAPNSADSGTAILSKAIVIAVLAVSFTIIIAVNTYKPVPTVLMSDNIKRAGGGCGGGKGGVSGGEVKNADGQPARRNPCGN